MIDFTRTLNHFTAAIVANDGAGLASLFTEDGVYDDYFFGPQRGRAAIAAMLDHFFEGGEQYRWDFVDPVSDGRIGYARYRFSYVAKVPEARGKVVVFDGMGRFTFEENLIATYDEVFDRGMALAQLDFDPVRIKKIMTRYADQLRADPASAPHLRR